MTEVQKSDLIFANLTEYQIHQPQFGLELLRKN